MQTSSEMQAALDEALAFLRRVQLTVSANAYCELMALFKLMRETHNCGDTHTTIVEAMVQLLAPFGDLALGFNHFAPPQAWWVGTDEATGQVVFHAEPVV